MASLITSTVLGLSPSPLYNRTSGVSVAGKPNHRFGQSKVLCSSTSGDSNSKRTSDDGEPSLGKFDRRVVLIGLGAAGIGAADPLAFGAPVVPPDLTKCGAANSPVGATPTNCWPPVTTESVDLKLPSQNSPMPNLRSKAEMANAAEIPRTLSSGDFPKPLNSILRVDVARPKKGRSKKEKEEEEEVLVIKGIELDRDKFVKFDVFINDEDDPVSRPGNTEFAGSYVNVPRKNKSGTRMTTCLRLGISELLEDLDAENDDSVLVSLVPRAGTDAVNIGGIEIEFLAE